MGGSDRIVGSTLQYLTFEQIGITFAVVAIAFSSIILVLNTVKAVREAREQAKKPTVDKFKEHDEKFKEHDSKFQEHEDRLESLEQCCEEVHGKLDNDYEFQKNALETNKLILKSLMQLLKHALNGDDTDGLKAVEAAIDNYLVEHQK